MDLADMEGPFHPARTVVGDCNNDDNRLRRHVSEDLSRDVCRVAVCAHRRTDNSTSGSGDRVQLRAILLAHPGAGKAAQEATTNSAGRGRQTQGVDGQTRGRRRSGLFRYWRT